MYSTILKFITYIMVMSSLLHSAAESVWLPNGIWKLVNYKGVYIRNSNDYTKWNEDGLQEIVDIGDSLTTYAVANSGETDHLYNAAGGALDSITLTENNTTAIGAVIGVFAIKGTKSPSADKTEIDGSVTKSVAIKFATAKLKTNVPMYRMYLKCDGDKPCLRLDYQADYEGDTFKVKFGEENYVFVAEFDHMSTYGNAATLDDENTRIAAAITTAPIEDIVDFNITDNNLSQMSTSNFDLENENHLRSYNSARGENIEIYTFKDEWKLFNSANANADSNAFTDLTVGTGYWMKASSSLAHSDGNFTKIGLITNATATFNKDAYTKGIEIGWNMLAFKNSNFRYSPTGMFIDKDIGSVDIFFNTNANNETDTNFTINSKVNIDASDVNESIRKVNAAVKTRNLLFNENVVLRAFPAMNSDYKSGILIISDQLFEINSTNTTHITGLSGESLTMVNKYYQRSKYGDYILGIGLNDINATSEINVTMDISIPSVNTGDFRVYDLNESNNANKLAKIDFDFNRSSVNSAGDKRAATNTFLIDFNFNVNTNYSANNAMVYNDVLMASNKRFSVEDTTYTRAFEFVKAGSFRVVGSSTVDVSINTETVVALCTAINAQRENTDVECTNLGEKENKNYFAIASNKTINLDLLENDSNGTLFNDLSLDTTLPPEGNLTFLKGAIVKVYTHKDILYSSNIEINSTVYDTNATYDIFERRFNDPSFTTNVVGSLTSDLSNTIADLRIAPAWSLDFPTDGPMLDLAEQNKRIDSILSLEYSQTFEPYWLISDLTNDPDEWYGNGAFASDSNVYNDDSQSLLKVSEDKAYWVKIKTLTKNVITIDNRADNLRTSYSYHFGSDIENIDKPLSLTTNNIDHTLYVRFVNGRSGAIANSDYYDVSATIKGKSYKMRKVGTAFQLRINNNYFTIEPELDKDIPIFISAYDNIGSKVVETGTPIYHLKYSKPKYPQLSWSANGELVILNEDVNKYKYYFYEGFISDTERGRKDHFLEDNKSNLFSFVDLLGWEKADGDDDDGELRVIRAVTKDGDMYSDSISILYAPLKFGHAIEVNSTQMSKSKPYSFLSKKPMSEDSGVQITRLKKATDDEEGIKLVYYPDGGLKKEGKNQLHSFAGTYTMFLKITSNDKYPVATITYLQSYAGKKFYVTYNGTLYHGEFASDDTFNNDSSSYALTGSTKKDLSGVLNGTSYMLTGHGYEIDFGGSSGSQEISISRAATDVETKNAQPIYIPGKFDEQSVSEIVSVNDEKRLIELGACYINDQVCIDGRGGNTGGGNTGGGNTGGGNTGGGNTGGGNTGGGNTGGGENGGLPTDP